MALPLLALNCTFSYLLPLSVYLKIAETVTNYINKTSRLESLLQLVCTSTTYSAWKRNSLQSEVTNLKTQGRLM